MLLCEEELRDQYEGFRTVLERYQKYQSRYFRTGYGVKNRFQELSLELSSQAT